MSSWLLCFQRIKESCRIQPIRWRLWSVSHFVCLTFSQWSMSMMCEAETRLALTLKVLLWKCSDIINFFLYAIIGKMSLGLLHLSAEALKKTWHDTYQQIKRKGTSRQNPKVTLVFLAGTATTSSRNYFCEKLWSRFFQMSLLMEQCHATVTWVSETHLVVYESRHCTQDFNKRPQLAYELYIHGTFSFE